MKLWYVGGLVVVTGLAFLLLKFHTTPKQPEHNLFRKRNTDVKITSPAFQDNHEIPKKYTCDGEDVSPPLNFTGIPDNTKTLTLMMEDPDAPGKTWVHWTIYNIPQNIHMISEDNIPEGSVEGMTDFGKPGYGGPCPPSGIHHYHIKLYALDEVLTFGDPNPPRNDAIMEAMHGHIIKQAELIGLFSKK